LLAWNKANLFEKANMAAAKNRFHRTQNKNTKR
jgi:hypothetical protein